MWRARLVFEADLPLIDVMLDATGISRSCPVYQVVVHREEFHGFWRDRIVGAESVAEDAIEALTRPFWIALNTACKSW